MKRVSQLKRTTKETSIDLSINLDGNKDISIETGIGFFDHMLTLLAFHANIDLTLKATGDTFVDDHHTVEDVGIILGDAFKEALGDKVGIERYSYQYMPMDEALTRVVLDISNRPICEFNASFNRPMVGDFATENVLEFLRAFTNQARITLHVDVIKGTNTHHIIESIFKGLGRAIKQAILITSDTVSSSKGVL
ncbi:MAG: imidazoleglycerol-phosphate dehydratase HisB [Candidatus Izemoplasmataceae bacterium]